MTRKQQGWNMQRRFWKSSKARSRQRHIAGTMNKTEQAYSERLQEMVERKEIAGWRFEAVRLKLATNTYYTPDFWVQRNDGGIEIHEVKACRANGAFLCEDDARVKIKVAAEIFHEFAFVMAGKLPKKSGGHWRFEWIGGTSDG